MKYQVHYVVSLVEGRVHVQVEVEKITIFSIIKKLWERKLPFLFT